MTLNVKADPAKPYKTYAAIVSAFLSSILLTASDLPGWAVAVITATVSAIAVYLTSNPQVQTLPPDGEPVEPVEDEHLE